MLLLAFKRVLGYALENPGKLAASNGTFFVLLLPAALMWGASQALGWIPPWLAVLLIYLWVWMSAAWLVESMRRRLEGKPFWIRWSLIWLLRDGKRHFANALLGGSLLLWLATNFWILSKTLEPGTLRLALKIATASVALWVLLASYSSLALGNGEGTGWFKRLRLYAVAPLAWLPAILGSLLLGVIVTGVVGLLIPPQHWAARVFGLPLFFAPVFTSALAAGMLAAVDLEIRAVIDKRSLKEAHVPGLKELFKPWEM